MGTPTAPPLMGRRNGGCRADASRTVAATASARRRNAGCPADRRHRRGRRWWRGRSHTCLRPGVDCASTLYASAAVRICLGRRRGPCRRRGVPRNSLSAAGVSWWLMSTRSAPRPVRLTEDTVQMLHRGWGDVGAVGQPEQQDWHASERSTQAECRRRRRPGRAACGGDVQERVAPRRRPGGRRGGCRGACWSGQRDEGDAGDEQREDDDSEQERRRSPSAATGFWLACRWSWQAAERRDGRRGAAGSPAEVGARALGGGGAWDAALRAA